MTTKEFSNQFDVLYNNIMSNQAPGLDEYEKSVFLTKAQDELVKAYFDPKSNKVFEGFDGSEKRQIDFSMLMKTVPESSITPTGGVTLSGLPNAKYFKIPEDILLYINEALTVTRDGVGSVRLTVVPIDYNEFNRLMSKPFGRPLKKQAWRLINTGGAISITYNDYSGLASAIATTLTSAYSSAPAVKASTVYANIDGTEVTKDGSNRLVVNGTYYITSTGSLSQTATDGAAAFSALNLANYMDKTTNASDTYVEIIPGPNDVIGEYVIRYVARPNPIILIDLGSSHLTINGQHAEMTSRLDPIIHEEILQRAVELAKAAYTGDLSSQVALGANSATDKGYVNTSSK